MEFLGQYCITHNYVYIQGIVQNIDADVDGSDFMATGSQSEQEEKKWNRFGKWRTRWRHDNKHKGNLISQ